MSQPVPTIFGATTGAGSPGRRLRKEPMASKPRVALTLLAFVCILALAKPLFAEDRMIDGVPLPDDARIHATGPGGVQTAWAPWLGVWVGSWGGVLKHVLVIESVSADG